ncbi:hypothetical protein K402DRAFT_105517 [Aulographum hederae CBS 113979]|uniref:Uncharacterized protein n=1 Tax=Aulographum hederae CBS 113979 TaxID=1176131 RepID=A0A6G1GXH0_9PEZI|nr:hypothetical protein K402DRAFT_105517 [Aulographum hederae CBS 113979]
MIVALAKTEKIWQPAHKGQSQLQNMMNPSTRGWGVSARILGLRAWKYRQEFKHVLEAGRNVTLSLFERQLCSRDPRALIWLTDHHYLALAALRVVVGQRSLCDHTKSMVITMRASPNLKVPSSGDLINKVFSDAQQKMHAIVTAVSYLKQDLDILSSWRLSNMTSAEVEALLPGAEAKQKRLDKDFAKQSKLLGMTIAVQVVGWDVGSFRYWVNRLTKREHQSNGSVIGGKTISLNDLFHPRSMKSRTKKTSLPSMSPNRSTPSRPARRDRKGCNRSRSPWTM